MVLSGCIKTHKSYQELGVTELVSERAEIDNKNTAMEIDAIVSIRTEYSELDKNDQKVFNGNIWD